MSVCKLFFCEFPGRVSSLRNLLQTRWGPGILLFTSSDGLVFVCLLPVFCYLITCCKIGRAWDFVVYDLLRTRFYLSPCSFLLSDYLLQNRRGDGILFARRTAAQQYMSVYFFVRTEKQGKILLGQVPQEKCPIGWVPRRFIRLTFRCRCESGDSFSIRRKQL